MARKFLSLLLALVMVFAVSSALAESPGDIYEVEMFNVYANYMGIQPGWYGKILEDKLGIRLNIIAPNVAGNGDALYQSRTAAGNLGDILILDRNKMIDCYKAGLLLDITPYLADCPNLQKLSVAYNRFAEIIGSGDQIYVLPGKVSTAPTDKPAARGVNPDKGTFVRLDYWSELGAPHVKNIDELFENLYKMQDAHPENENGEKNYAFSLFPDWDSYSLRCVPPPGPFLSACFARVAFFMTFPGFPWSMISWPPSRTSAGFLSERISAFISSETLFHPAGRSSLPQKIPEKAKLPAGWLPA